MKLKLVINKDNEDYKLLKNTLTTVSQLRKTAILRFTTDRLIIISTPKSSSSNTILTGDQGQLWCTIPKDVFSLYNVLSIRDENTIAMECQCDSLLNVLKKYDKLSTSNLTIKLQSTPEWNQAESTSNSDNTLLCALGFTFEEQLYMDGITDSKVVSNSFKVGVRLLYKSQDLKIQEPMINYSQLLMLQLPPNSGDYGHGFSNFIRRLDRYDNLNHMFLIGKRHESQGELKLCIQELDWNLDILWKIPLDIIMPQHEQKEFSQKNPSKSQQINNMIIEDSEIEYDNSLDYSGNKTREESQEDNELTIDTEHRVQIKARDWKVCSKLYDSFEEIVIAIAHDESCVLHCSLDRDNKDDQNDEPRERGQIIYYMARSKPL